jgi:hypothetical protein
VSQPHASNIGVVQDGLHVPSNACRGNELVRSNSETGLRVNTDDISPAPVRRASVCIRVCIVLDRTLEVTRVGGSGQTKSFEFARV